MFYIETRIAPHGRRAVIGGQDAAGLPREQYATRDAAKAAADLVWRDMVDADRVVREVNIRPVTELRIPGSSRYMRLI